MSQVQVLQGEPLSESSVERLGFSFICPKPFPSPFQASPVHQHPHFISIHITENHAIKNPSHSHPYRSPRPSSRHLIAIHAFKPSHLQTNERHKTRCEHASPTSIKRMDCDATPTTRKQHHIHPRPHHDVHATLTFTFVRHFPWHQARFFTCFQPRNPASSSGQTYCAAFLRPVYTIFSNKNG